MIIQYELETGNVVTLDLLERDGELVISSSQVRDLEEAGAKPVTIGGVNAWMRNPGVEAELKAFKHDSFGWLFSWPAYLSFRQKRLERGKQ